MSTAIHPAESHTGKQLSGVFISYSHKDKRWKDRLVTHLVLFQKQGLLDVWDDSRITAGDDWYQEIQQVLGTAQVAVLLVSAHFLASDFVLREEVPRLLERRHAEGLWVIPLVVTPCAWEEIDWLKPMQAELRNNRPLSSLDQLPHR